MPGRPDPETRFGRQSHRDVSSFRINRVNLLSRPWVIRVVLLGATPVAALAQRRRVHRFVRDQDGQAIKSAGVHVKNLRILEIRTYLTDGDGLYSSATLNPDIDYQVQAVYGGRFSEVDCFASAPDVTVNLCIDLSTLAKDPE